MLGIATLIWGSTFVVVKIALNDVEPIFFIGLRFLTGALLLAVLFPKKLLTINAKTFWMGTSLGLLLCVGFMAQTVGLTYTTASKSAFITGMLVVFAPLLQFLIQRRLPTLGNLIGVACVTVGLYLLTSPAGSEFNIGDGLTLLCAFLFGLYIVYLDIISKQTEVFHLTFLQIASTGIVCIVLAPLVGGIEVSFTWSFVVSVVYLTLFATLLTTYLQTRYQKETTPTRAAIIFSAEPIVAAILAFLILGELIGALGILGGGIIIGGLVVSQLSDDVPFLNRRLIQDKAEQASTKKGDP